jgi:hypothetical protein
VASRIESVVCVDPPASIVMVDALSSGPDDSNTPLIAASVSPNIAVPVTGRRPLVSATCARKTAATSTGVGVGDAVGVGVGVGTGVGVVPPPQAAATRASTPSMAMARPRRELARPRRETDMAAGSSSMPADVGRVEHRALPRGRHGPFGCPRR